MMASDWHGPLSGEEIEGGEARGHWRPRRRLRAALLSAVLFVAASACGDDSPPTDEVADDPTTDEVAVETETIRVGLLNAETGPFADLGRDVNDGFHLFLRERGNQLAGVDVEVLQEDEGEDATVALGKIRRMVEQEEIHVLVGLTSSLIASAAVDYIRDTDVPLIITVAADDSLTQGDWSEQVFRVSSTGSQDTMPFGTYACEELGHETMNLFALDYPFGWQASGGFARAYVEAGCEVVREIYAPVGTEDYAGYIERMDMDASAAFLVAPGGDAIRFQQSYRDLGIQLPLLGHGAITDELILPQLDDLARGAITSVHYSRVLDTPQNEALRESFEEEYGRWVSQYAEHGYTSGVVLEAALEATGGQVDPELLTEALRHVGVEAPRGPLSFDEYGQSIYPLYLRQTEEVDGEMVNTVIHTLPDVTQFYRYEPEEYLDFEPYEQLVGRWAE